MLLFDEIFDDDSMFQDSIDEVAAQSFYYATLSEYSTNLNLCYKKYIEKLENGIDILT